MRKLWIALIALVAVCSISEVAWAQSASVTPVNLKELLATLINTAGVMLAVQGIKRLRPYLADKYGWALPIVAVLLGPIVATAQAYLAAKLGFQIDLSLITAALTGGAAVAANQVYRQAKEGPTGIAMRRP